MKSVERKPQFPDDGFWPRGWNLIEVQRQVQEYAKDIKGVKIVFLTDWVHALIEEITAHRAFRYALEAKLEERKEDILSNIDHVNTTWNEWDEVPERFDDWRKEQMIEFDAYDNILDWLKQPKQ